MGLAASKCETASGGINADERWANIQKFSQDYFHYLTTKGGFVLTAEQRVKIANMTLTDSLTCSGCKSLPKEACLRPGIDLYKTIEKCDPEGHGDVFAHMVHSMVNHQTRIYNDPAWYQATLTRLKESNLLDESRLEEEGLTSEQQREYLHYGLFAEIALVISTVHGIHMTTIMKGAAAPEPLIASKDATPPSYFDWSKVFRKGKTARNNKSLATAPFISQADIDKNSNLLKELLPDDGQLAKLFGLGMVPFTPYLAVTWSPVDFWWADQFTHNVNLESEVFFHPHKHLDPERRCADNFSRRDVEVVAVAVSEGYQCFF